MATRIQARAIRRCGELLKKIEPATPGGSPGRPKKGAAADTHSRTRAASEAGLSERQKNTALRVASVPKRDFERQVESDDPPRPGSVREVGS